MTPTVFLPVNDDYDCSNTYRSSSHYLARLNPSFSFIARRYIKSWLLSAAVILLPGLEVSAQQKQYTIKADTLILSSACDTAELVLRNRTKNLLNGVLTNKGDGVTEFRKLLQKLNDSMYIIGADTMNIGGVKNVWVGDYPFVGQPNIRIASGVIRPIVPESTGQPISWEWLGAATRNDTLLFSGPIETTAGHGLKIFYRSIQHVLGFVCTADDAFVRNGVNIGASVDVADATMYMTAETSSYSGYLRGNGTSWEPHGNISSGVTFDYTNGLIRWTVTNPAARNIDYVGALATWIGTANYRMRRVMSGLGSYSVGYQIVDNLTNTDVTSITPAMADAILISNPATYTKTIPIQLRSVSTDPFITSNADISVIAIYEDLASPHLLNGAFFAGAVSSSQIALTWPAVKTGAGIYTVQRSTTANFHSSTTIYTGSATSFNDTGLTTATKYYYRIWNTRTFDDARSDRLLASATTH